MDRQQQVGGFQGTDRVRDAGRQHKEGTGPHRMRSVVGHDLESPAQYLQLDLSVRLMLFQQPVGFKGEQDDRDLAVARNGHLTVASDRGVRLSAERGGGGGEINELSG